MNVLYLYQYFNTREGYAGTRAYEFSRYLVSQGHQVTVITGRSEHEDQAGEHAPAEEWVDGIRVRRLGVSYSQLLGSGMRMASFMEYASLATLEVLGETRPSVVFATSTPLTVGIPGLLGAWRHRVPFVFEVRDLWPEIPIALGFLNDPTLIRAARRLERTLYARADALIALSPGMRRGMVAAGAEEDKITTIPNMADLELFSRDLPLTSWRSTVGLPKDAFVVVHPGAMGHANDLSQALEAAAQLRGSGIYFALVGQGSERAALEQRALAEGLDNVIFAGPYTRREIPWVLAGSNVGLLSFRKNPVLYSNSANKFGDYLAAALPVLVTFPGWQAKLLTRYQGGVLASGGAQDVAEHLRRLNAERGLCEELGKGARRLAQERLSRDLMVRRFLEVLQGVVRDGGTA